MRKLLCLVILAILLSGCVNKVGRTKPENSVNAAFKGSNHNIANKEWNKMQMVR